MCQSPWHKLGLHRVSGVSWSLRILGVLPVHGALSLLGTGMRMVTPARSRGAPSGCCDGRLGDHPAAPCTALGSAPLGLQPLCPCVPMGCAHHSCPVSCLLLLSHHVRLRFPSGLASITPGLVLGPGCAYSMPFAGLKPVVTLCLCRSIAVACCHQSTFEVLFAPRDSGVGGNLLSGCLMTALGCSAVVQAA